MLTPRYPPCYSTSLWTTILTWILYQSRPKWFAILHVTLKLDIWRAKNYRRAVYRAGSKMQPEQGPHTNKSLYIISYHLFSFRGSVQDYKIHMDMEIVKFI